MEGIITEGIPLLFPLFHLFLLPPQILAQILLDQTHNSLEECFGIMIILFRGNGVGGMMTAKLNTDKGLF